MGSMATGTPVSQLEMVGMPKSVRPKANAGAHNVRPGQEVMYLGDVAGGPRFGARGVVKQALARRVVADMGHSGTWHIPYYFLTVPLRAG